MHVAICGAGVIGAACAYYLSRRGVRVTIVERATPAVAASGKSGGFLARSWCDGTPQQDLARTSFDLHCRLERELEADYGYRAVTTRMVVCSKLRDVAAYARIPAPPWLEGRAAVADTLGTPEDTAQLDPARFTHALIDAARRNGAALVTARIDGVLTGNSGRNVVGVLANGEPLLADRVIIAMGPWTQRLAANLGLPPVMGLKGYSIVLQPEVTLPAEALFVEYEAADGERPSPEVVTRADGSVYLCGIGDTQAVPHDPLEVSVDDAACDDLIRIAGEISPQLRGARVSHRQACYRPICTDAIPVIGRCPDLEGAYVATGHNCWGMLNAPGSGLAMSELVIDGEARVLDLSSFDPRRLT